MTLNLLLTSSNVVYLSGDFRLTYANNEHKDELDTQKLIPVIRYGWGALIAYSGIAKAPPFVKDTGSWILAKTNSIPLGGKFDELAKSLLDANEWVSKIPGDNRLVFSIVGFVERRPFMMVISNFIDLDGNITDSRSQLRVYQTRPKQAEVRVMGDRNAVLPEEKNRIKKLLQENKGYLTIQNHIADINAKAAERSTNQSISRECVTGYILPSGAAEISPHGIEDGQGYLPGFVLSEFWKQGIVGFKAKYDENGNPLNPTWGGMTARFQGGKGKDRAAIILNKIRNVGEPIHDGIQRKGISSAWKMAGSNEPKSYTFTLDKPLQAPTKSRKK